MKESVEYAKDDGGRIWRVDYTKGSAEHFPFNEILGPESTEITECDRIDNYLRERGVRGLQFRQDKWYFRQDTEQVG